MRTSSKWARPASGDDPDTIWVTEMWRSQADLDASIEQLKSSPEIAAVMELVESWEMVELDLLGGKGAAAAPADGGAPFTIHTLADTKDALLGEITAHAKKDHDVDEITPEVLSAVENAIQQD